jgi:cyclopropane-fatty-acyl-phospholipid synthase
MDKLAVERRVRGPSLGTHVLSSVAAFFGERLIGRPKVGSVTITFPSGKTRTYGNPAGPGEHPKMVIHNFSVMPETLRRGTVGFAHAYMRGDVEVDDLTSLFRYFLQNRQEFQPRGAGWFGRATADIAYHLSRANTIDGSKENISEHYDLGNAFYAEWLDPTMTYSSAYYSSDGQTLEDAQHAKYRRVAEMAGVKPGDSVLEIGCGWGGFAETVAREFDADVYGVTLSKEQLDYAEQRIHRQGLDNRATFHFEDYRHIRGLFDRIASIEMIEAVGMENWPSYFKTLFDRLKPGGTAAIQAITISERDFEGYRSTPDFIQRYIFPGGMLMTRAAMAEQAKLVGLVLENVDNFRLSYAKTLKLWRERFLERWETIRKMGFDETFRRKWVYYLAYCEAGFAEGSIDVGIYQYRKPV